MEVYRPQWVEPDSMKVLGYKLISDKEGYLKYENEAGTICPSYGKMPRGKTTVYLNTTYNPKVGEVYVGIKEDMDTRTVYGGICTTEDYFKLVLSSVR